MRLARAIIIASIWLGVTAAGAQQRETTVPAAAQPLLFQGIMVDAKGKTVGRLFIENGQISIVRQISGIWIKLAVKDFTTGFRPADFDLQYLYQSSDCTGNVYLSAGPTLGNDVVGPELGYVAIVPPATQPSIYFAGAPATVLSIKSLLYVASSDCSSVDNGGIVNGGASVYVGPIQSLPLSSWGSPYPLVSNDRPAYPGGNGP